MDPPWSPGKRLRPSERCRFKGAEWTAWRAKVPSTSGSRCSSFSSSLMKTCAWGGRKGLPAASASERGAGPHASWQHLMLLLDSPAPNQRKDIFGLRALALAPAPSVSARPGHAG